MNDIDIGDIMEHSEKNYNHIETSFKPMVQSKIYFFYPISDAFIDRNPMAIVFVYHSNVGEK